MTNRTELERERTKKTTQYYPHRSVYVYLIGDDFWWSMWCSALDNWTKLSNRSHMIIFSQARPVMWRAFDRDFHLFSDFLWKGLSDFWWNMINDTNIYLFKFYGSKFSATFLHKDSYIFIQRNIHLNKLARNRFGLPFLGRYSNSGWSAFVYVFYWMLHIYAVFCVYRLSVLRHNGNDN